VLSLVSGVLFGVGLGVLLYFQDEHPHLRAAVVAGVFSGALFGAYTGSMADRNRRKFREALGWPEQEARSGAARAVRRGSVPQDVQVRTVARRMVAYRLESLCRHRRLNLTFLGFGVVAYVALALILSRRWWFGAALFDGF
jgi:hypothetical protein